MTKFLADIIAQPKQLQGTLSSALGEQRAQLDAAAKLLQTPHVFIVGIGASWNAGLAVKSFFDAAGRPAHLVDASELNHTVHLPPDAVAIALSRSGKSVEIVNMLKQRGRTRIIGITNDPKSPLGEGADVTLLANARFDHAISVTMYSALALLGGVAAQTALQKPLDAKALSASLEAAAAAIPHWREQLETSAWFRRDATVYFLARGGSLASAHETGLLWEEGAKAPATALTTGGFRHGPQEIVGENLSAGLWPDSGALRKNDLALARDLEKNGAGVMLIGRNLEHDAAKLVLNLPAIAPEWQFLTDIVPAQLAAERLARLRGVDCDAFRLCSFVVTKEEGL